MKEETTRDYARRINKVIDFIGAHLDSCNKPYRIIDVALDAGFSTPESFSRAYRKAQGQTPSEFRSKPQWHE